MIDLDAVRARINLVDLVGETVRLKKQGQQHYGLCPWHQDRSPTLRVDPKKQLWMCPSCQIGGDAFSWLKHRDGIGFRDAARDLAVRAGIGAAAVNLPAERVQLAPVPADPKFPRPRVEPSLAWGAQHLMRGGLPVIILNDFPGRRLYLSIAEQFADFDVIHFPRMSGGITAPAERMYLAPIARAEIWIAPSLDRWENERAERLMALIEAWRRHVIAA